MLSLILFMVIPAGPGDLAALLLEADRNNPEIAAASSAARAAEAVPSQAEAPPDPLVSLSYTNESLDALTLGRSEDSMLTFSWTQEVPYPGVLRSSGDAARHGAEMIGRRLEAARWSVRSRVVTAYASLYRIDRTASLLSENRSLLLSLQDAARARYESGEGILENVLKAQTESSRLDSEIEKLAGDRVAAQAELDALLGRAESTPLGPIDSVPPIAADLDLASLEQDATTRSPELLEAETAAQRDEALVDLARRQLKPDLMWGASYTNRGALDPMVMGMFGVRLPVHRERKQAQRLVQASNELDATRSQVAAMRLKLTAEVRSLVARARRAASLERIYQEAIIPQARTALQSAMASYSVGRVDFLTLLNDFTSLLTHQIDYESQRSDRLQALAALERLTARQLVLPPGAASPLERPQEEHP